MIVFKNDLICFRESCSTNTPCFWILCHVLWVLLIARELCQFTFGCLRYFFGRFSENFMEWTLIVLSGLLLYQHKLNFEENQIKAIAAFIIVLSWAEMVITFGRHPCFRDWNIFILMVFNVFWKFFKILCMYSVFIVGFALGFFILLHELDSNDNGSSPNLAVELDKIGNLLNNDQEIQKYNSILKDLNEIKSLNANQNQTVEKLDAIMLKLETILEKDDLNQINKTLHEIKDVVSAENPQLIENNPNFKAISSSLEGIKDLINEQDTYPHFNTIQKAMVKSLTMFIGELEFGDLDLNTKWYHQIYLLLFVFLIVVVLMNVLTGVAIIGESILLTLILFNTNS